MNGQNFVNLIHTAFKPFLTNLGFLIENPSISGRFYRVSFRSHKHVVLVSYEPGDNALFVMVFNLKKGELSDIDDRTITPRLSDLNKQFMNIVTPEERQANNNFFQSIKVKDKEEEELLKAAKELRLVLPKYIGQ